ncbi:MAG: substrate-binding domain-containing protein [Verrucomicrobia bacterium]|nr:substrate-binding domain-containing protein [Verrucomicrobiota bacterium]
MKVQAKLKRRDALKAGGLVAGSSVLAAWTGCEKAPSSSTGAAPKDSSASRKAYAHEEYVWLSANANLPLFTAHDHPALRMAAEELGVKVTMAGPNSVDIPGLIAAIEQTTARKPAGMMVVGWDPSALVPLINKAVDSGIPVVCVDADVPASKRLAFIGTDWFDLGVRQGEAMVKALAGKKGKIALFGLIEQEIDQKAFAGFRSVAEKAGLTVLDPQQDKGNQAEAARVAAAVIQAQPDLSGMAGFDSESGPGIGQAIKEAGKAGQIIATCVDAEDQHLRLVKEGVLTAAVGQKRELFTYVGLRALFEANHSPLKFTSDDQRAGIVPIPINYNTGTYTVTKENVDLFLKSA